MHDYSISGYGRFRFVYFLTMLAVLLLPLVTTLGGWIGVTTNLTTFSVFAGLFFIFDNWLWRQQVVSWFLKTPDLAGQWICSGKTNSVDGVARDWSGKITISQTWSKISIALETETSTSISIIARLNSVAGQGFQLIYNYSNETKVRDPKLLGHAGTSKLLISKDLKSATGTYFNDHPRPTSGSMVWKRIKKEPKEN